jgi:hypothetical protein
VRRSPTGSGTKHGEGEKRDAVGYQRRRENLPSAGCIPPPAPRITTRVAVTTPIKAVSAVPAVAAAPALAIVSPPSVALVPPAPAVATAATAEAAPAALVAAARVAGRRVVAAIEPPQERVGFAVGAAVAVSIAVSAAVAVAVGAAVVRAGSIAALGAPRLLPLPFPLAHRRVLAVRLGARLLLGLLLRGVPVVGRVRVRVRVGVRVRVRVRVAVSSKWYVVSVESRK